MVDCILNHNFNCPYKDSVCAWDNYDYSDPNTKLVTHLAPGTKAKILERKFPGVLVELEDGTQYWICECDVHKTDG